MSDIWMDVDIAITIPVNKVPLVALSDGYTIDETIAYNESGMDLNWNFVTTAGVMTQTNVVPTTAGDYDWTHVGNGMYKIEMTASGGASANNDTEGFGWFSGKADAILPFSGPIIGFRAAALNNALIDGGDNLDINVVQWLGQACHAVSENGVPKVDLDQIGGVVQSLTDLKDLVDTGYDPATHKIQGVVLADTITTYTGNTKQTANNNAILAHADYGNAKLARTGADSDTLETLSDQIDLQATVAKQDIIDTNVDQIEAAVITNATGVDIAADIIALKAETVLIVADTNELQTDNIPGTLATNDTSVDTQLAAIKAETALIVADTNELQTDDIPGTLATIAGYLDTEIAAILADTNELQGDWVNGGRLDLLLDAVKVVTDALTSATATKMAASGGTIVLGIAATGILSTTEMTSNLSISVNDQYNGRILIFKSDTTTAALRGQATDITDTVTTNGKLTFTALTTAPVNGDTFCIV